jgi:hypothetical protein
MLQDQSTGKTESSKRTSFHDAKTPLCSTVHFSDAETPLKNTGHCFPDAETPLFGTFHFFSVTETSHPPIILTPETTPSNTCFAATFPVAETPATFHFLLLLKHRLSATFHQFPRC